MNITFNDYFYRLQQCFLGKCIGGTLGMPFEGVNDMLHLTYYDPIPTEMVGNDDLDLQVIWLECIRRRGLPISSATLIEGWMEHIRSVWDEYGVAQRNIRHKIYAPVSGKFDNKFTDGLGAAIRTEIWAALAPGNPDLAAYFAELDARVDHCGDGVDAAKFIAAFESLAYIETDIDTIYEKAITYITPNSRLYHALRDTKTWASQEKDFCVVREKILNKYGNQNFTDVSVNIPFVLLGLLTGEGDFDKTLCNAVNCGYDADCVGATVGSILGLLYPNNIPEKWSAPIGEKLVLSLYMVGTHQADTIKEMCMQIACIAGEIQEYYKTGIKITNPPNYKPQYRINRALCCAESIDNISVTENTSVLLLSPLYMALEYPRDIAITAGENVRYTLTVASDIADRISINLFMPYGWEITPNEIVLDLQPNKPVSYNFSVKAPYSVKHNYIEMLDISVKGEHFAVTSTAGIPLKYEWRVKKCEEFLGECPAGDFFADAESIFEANHFMTVSEGNYYYALDFKSPAYIKDAILVAEGTRALRVWIDGELISESDGCWYVPACHRGMGAELDCRRRINIMPRWHHLVLEVADGEEGEIFFGLFKPYGHEWLEDIETRKAYVCD